MNRKQVKVADLVVTVLGLEIVRQLKIVQVSNSGTHPVRVIKSIAASQNLFSCSILRALKIQRNVKQMDFNSS